MKYPHTRNDITLIKDLEEDTSKHDDTPCAWIRRVNIAKIFIMPKSISIDSMQSLNIPVAFFTEQKVPKFVRNH